MTDDIYEPLSLYRDTLCAAHARHVARFFEELVARSGVDVAANGATVAQLNQVSKEIGTTEGGAARWRAVRLALALAVLGCGGFLLWGALRLAGGMPLAATALCGGLLALAGAVIGILVIIKKVNPRLRGIAALLWQLRCRRDGILATAHQQMAPLNNLYDWHMVPKLIQETLPNLVCDPFFTEARLAELRGAFGWSDDFSHNRSVLFTQSGAIAGNPFVLAETLDFRMGVRTYEGRREISWQERVRDANGQMRWVTRHQTLYASITRPAPEHTTSKFLIYGNEAAPNLSFSRRPSPLSALGDSCGDRWRKRRAIRKLEAFSRNLDDDSGFTIMANREFDALFNATDRDHEVQFRLLFTPLAQQQMVALLKDDKIGFGDDFSFVKTRMINLISPAHLAHLDLSAAPSLFYSHDLAAARKFFNDYNNRYFKSFYFALAPLLTIPLYQQHRSHGDIYKDVLGDRACFWEHEAAANFHGQAVFKHPLAATPSILKTTLPLFCESWGCRCRRFMRLSLLLRLAGTLALHFETSSGG